MVLLTMLMFPNGALGEGMIHEFIYYLLDFEEFFCMKEPLAFIAINDTLHFSPVVHSSIVNNCKDVANVERGSFSSQGSTVAMFSDDLRFDLYDSVNNKEKGFKKHVPDHSPKIYFLSSMGRSVAILALREKLNKEQTKLISNIVGEYKNI